MKILNMLVIVISIVGIFPNHSLASFWSQTISEDEMTGEKSIYVTSRWVPPIKSMSFPYSNVQAMIGIGCNSSSKWVYFNFNKSPNILNSDTKDGYSVIKTRVKWDDSIRKTKFIQKWGGKGLHFYKPKSAIEKMINSSSVKLELNWYSVGKVYFYFPLNGVSERIEKMKVECERK